MSCGNTSRSRDTARPDSMKSNTRGSNTYRPAFTRLLGASPFAGFSTNRTIRSFSSATTPKAPGFSTGHTAIVPIPPAVRCASARRSKSIESTTSPL